MKTKEVGSVGIQVGENDATETANTQLAFCKSQTQFYLFTLA